MNEVLKINAVDDFPVRGVYPEKVINKIKEEQKNKAEAIQSLLDLNSNDNKEIMKFVTKEFDIGDELRDKYGNFSEVINQKVNNKGEVSKLFKILNGSPLGLCFVDKLNENTLKDDAVRKAFISWATKLTTEKCAGIDLIDDVICRAFDAIANDKKIHPLEESGDAKALIALNDKNHSSKVFTTYNHIWACLGQVQSGLNPSDKGLVKFIDQGLKFIGRPQNIHEDELGKLYQSLLENLRDSVYRLTDASIIGPMIRDTSSILSILESFSDRSIPNLEFEYLHWKANDKLLDEILDYLLKYYNRLIHVISDMSCFDNEQDIYFLKQLIENFILLHKEGNLRIRALESIDKTGRLSKYIIGKFLDRQLNDNIKRDPSVINTERNVKEKALQIFENILKEEQDSQSLEHIDRKLTDCVQNPKEDYKVRNMAIEIFCNARKDISAEKVKWLLDNIIEYESSVNKTQRHCPFCGNNVQDQKIQEIILGFYETILKTDTHPQSKELIEKNLEKIILDAQEDAYTRKHAVQIISRNLRDEDAFKKQKSFLKKIIEKQGEKEAATYQ